jgi:multidrug efflux pump
MILLCVNLISPDDSRDQLYLSNYATIQLKDALARLSGVGDVLFLGARDYSMRVWLDPNRLAARRLTAADVVRALREQNVQVAAGRIGQPPVPKGLDFQYPINAQGRLRDPSEFENVIVKTGARGEITRIRDVGTVELGASNVDVNTYLNGKPSVTLAIFQRPGANALATAKLVREEMQRLATRFPQGMEHRIVYDTTVFIEDSVHEVYKTLLEAFVLVFIVVLVFLQDWRATLLPMIDVPVSLIGTFAVMSALGFSLNNLSLFGLVLAIGIVVDDAIVVVENVERWMARGLPPREATIRAMDEITGPVIAITLVLSSVFLPTAFLSGIAGQFYRQFALTIATATILSAVNALTMAPARAVTLIKPHGHAGAREALPAPAIAIVFAAAASWLLGDALLAAVGMAHGGDGAEASAAAPWLVRGVLAAAAGAFGYALATPTNRVLLGLFDRFNRVFDRATAAYGSAVASLLRVSTLVMALYVGLLVLTYTGFTQVPLGFLPAPDKGYLVVNAQLPDGASLERTEEVMARIDASARETDGVEHVIRVPGYSILTSNNLSNAGGMFVILEPFEKRVSTDRSADTILDELRAKFAQVQDAQILAFGAPPVDGLATTGAFKMFLEDRGDLGYAQLQADADAVMRTAAAQPGLTSLFSSFRATQPQLYLDVDRNKAKALGIALSDVFDTLQVYLGSAYANDFTRFGRNWQVQVQAESAFRIRPDDIGRLKVRNKAGDMVPLGTLVKVVETTGPAIVNRYNMFPAADVAFSTTGELGVNDGVALMESIAVKELPATGALEWTEIVFQQKLAGGTGMLVFAFGALLIFLVLAAQYESWSLPLAIILIVPMCLLTALCGVWLAGSSVDLFTQIGLVVLIGLAAKNAILIVEFARQLEELGKGRRDAVVEACRVRLRPILMTSLAFVFGVAPLITTEGAGAEMRFALGIAVFSGMIGVTLFGVLFTPVFYWVIRNRSLRGA